MVRVHILSWSIANGRKPHEGMMICHRCNNSLCVRPSHLYEGTQKDNGRDMVFFGSVRGEKHPRAILSESVVREARAIRATGETWLALSKRFGVSPTTIRDAILGISWSHVT